MAYLPVKDNDGFFRNHGRRRHDYGQTGLVKPVEEHRLHRPLAFTHRQRRASWARTSREPTGSRERITGQES